MPPKITAAEIELALAGFFDWRRNFIIPNVSNGFRHINYEIDVMVVTQSLYAYDIEIKVSAADLKRDQDKDKWRYCLEQHYFRKSYFAMPEAMSQHQDLVPAHAGIILVAYNERRYWYDAKVVREPVVDTLAKKVREDELTQLGRLTMLRMWDLKHSVHRLVRERHQMLVEEKERIALCQNQ
jgi:hypothetical protein